MAEDFVALHVGQMQIEEKQVGLMQAREVETDAALAGRDERHLRAPHEDALDSRYALMGLVPVGAIAGKGVPLW